MTRLAVCLSVVCALALPVRADPPPTPYVLQVEGRLLDANDQPVNGEHQLTASLHATAQEPNPESPAPALWSATYTVHVTQGLVALRLGDPALGEPIDPTVFESGTVYLEYAVDQVTLSPRLAVGATALSFRARRAETAEALDCAGCVADPMLADGAVTSRALADGAVGSSQLALAAVGPDALAEASVTASKIVPGAVGSDALADGSVTTAKLGALAVDTDALGDGAVTASKLAAGSVETAKVADQAITTAKIAPGAVTPGLLAANAVGTAALADGSVTAAKLADGIVTGAPFASGAGLASKTVGAAVDELAGRKAEVTLLPAGPNFLRDTRHFSQIFSGVDPAAYTPWDSTARGVWELHSSISGGSSATFNLAFRGVSSQSYLANGDSELGDSSALVSLLGVGRPDYTDFEILVLKATFQSADALSAIGYFRQGCTEFGGMYDGNQPTTLSALVKVVQLGQNQAVVVGSNGWPSEELSRAGDWTLANANQAKVGGCLDPLRFDCTGASCSGTTVVAIALPYIGSGNRQGFTWAGYAPWLVDDMP